MKFSVEREVLAETVAWVVRSLPQRPAVPVLSGVHISAGDDVLTLATFDYEFSARIELPAQVEEQGEIVVSGKLLNEITRSLKNGQTRVDFELKGTVLGIKCANFKSSMATMSLSEYPQLPVFPELFGTVDALELAKAAAQVTIAASRDETLPMLQGVKIEIDGDNIALLATDRFRLALRNLKWKPKDEQAKGELILKAKILLDVSKTMTSAGPVEINLRDENSSIIGFSAIGRKVTSQLIDGNYPPVRSLFPEVNPIHMVVDREELLGALKRVSLMSMNNNQIYLTFSQGSLNLSAGENGDNAASEDIGAHLFGEETSIAFNARFLIEGLNALNSPYARISFTDDVKPAIITEQEEIGGEDSKDFIYLLMPMRV